MILIVWFVGFIFLSFLVLSIKRGNSIIVNFYDKKEIINSNFFIDKEHIIYQLILFIIPVYLLCLFWRLFIIISNISIYFLENVSDKWEYKSLNIYMIILILSISTLLCWGDIMNKKYETSKYSKISLFFAVFLTLSLIWSIVMCITYWGIKYLYILDKLAQLAIIEEVFFAFINSELVLFSSLEKVIVFTFNLNIINFKWNELKNNLYSILLKNNIFINKNKNTLYTEYKGFFIRGRKGNIIIRGIQFIIDFSLLLKNKIYLSQYLFNINYYNKLIWGYKLAMILFLII
jgi:hypothetical protein